MDLIILFLYIYMKYLDHISPLTSLSICILPSPANSYPQTVPPFYIHGIYF
jgi:hypothetical protein